MASASDPGRSGALWQAVSPRCPDFPKSGPARGGTCLAQPALRSAIALVFTHPAAKAQTEARYRVSLLRGWQKRGPPSLI